MLFTFFHANCTCRYKCFLESTVVNTNTTSRKLATRILKTVRMSKQRIWWDQDLSVNAAMN